MRTTIPLVRDDRSQLEAFAMSKSAGQLKPQTSPMQMAPLTSSLCRVLALLVINSETSKTIQIPQKFCEGFP
jgi:hypothetical protein